MPNNMLLSIIEIIGTMVFAISGALTAAGKKFDLMGVGIIAFVTALGGGTIRDLLIGAHPVGWMKSKWFLLAVVVGVIVAYIFNRRLQYLRRTFFIFDAVGLGVFAIGGLEKALSYGIDPIYALVCAVITGSLGGLLRDVLCNDIPLVFRKEIYATAAFLGAGSYLLMKALEVPIEINFIVSVVLVIVIRVLAVRFNLGLPRINMD